ncbi:MAG: hypothetical protein WAN23_19930, partial [Candidatus Acidiferrales bacterium]
KKKRAAPVAEGGRASTSAGRLQQMLAELCDSAIKEIGGCCERRVLAQEAIELGAQAVGVHSGGLANDREILLILKEVFFSLPFRAKRTGNPFLNRCDNHCLPQALFNARGLFSQHPCVQHPCICSHRFPRICRGGWVRRKVVSDKGNALAEGTCRRALSHRDVPFQ